MQMIARFYRWVYLKCIGQFRGEVPMDIFDNRGIVELLSGTPSGDNRRTWWRRISGWNTSG